jgi:hypothetical protein
MTPRAYLLPMTIPQGWVNAAKPFRTKRMCAISQATGKREPSPGDRERRGRSAPTGGLAATATRDGQHPQQVMPPTFVACLDDIGGIFVTGALEFLDVFAVDHALAVLRQTVAEHIGHQHHIHLFADRTKSLRRLSQMFRRPDQFGMCIADSLTVDATSFELVDQRTSRELVVDDSDIAPQHVDGETHDATR